MDDQLIVSVIYYTGIFFVCSSFLVQVAYWYVLWQGFQHVRCTPVKPETDLLPAISVVVAARNESHNISSLLNTLTAQTHPQYEIVLVDDASTDETVVMATQHGIEPQRLRLVHVSDAKTPRKKHALTAGISNARFELLACTDADCLPPPSWLKILAGYHTVLPDTVLVGYSPILSEPTLLNLLVRYETMTTAFFTSAAIGWKRPYMAVGRNLSYPRSLFYKIGGFDHSLHSLSGDDDLFVQEVSRTNAGSVFYVLDSASFVYSNAPSGWRQWFRQKRRHTSAGRFYDPFIKRHLALFHGSNLCLWILPVVTGWTGFILLTAKGLFQYLILKNAAGTFKEKKLLRFFPLLEGLYMAYNTLIAPIGVLFPPKKWD
jgi:glycosyltransferase involved in cell wall biosynthesis